MKITFKRKSFFFNFLSNIKNSKKSFCYKKGWIIKLISTQDDLGFGEISPLNSEDLFLCTKQINEIPQNISKDKLLETIRYFHPCVKSGFISALAELEGLIKFKSQYKFNEIHQSAILVNSHSIIEELKHLKRLNIGPNKKLTIKLKMGIEDNKIEEKKFEEILNQNENNIRFRLDANGSLSRECANRWADILKNNNNFDWFEQPLSIDDLEGLQELNKKIPVALDESLIKYPQLINSWEGWQIRRPSQESNPLKLLKELKDKKSFRSISTSFETGIGRRYLYHLSYLQLLGSTPKVPGLALKQMPNTFLFKSDPQIIWNNL